MKAAGFSGAFTNGTDYDPAILERPQVAKNLDGAYVNVPFLPFESGKPAAERVRQDVEDVAPDADLDTSVGQGYWSADLFLRILERAGADLTPESFARGR